MNVLTNWKVAKFQNYLNACVITFVMEYTLVNTLQKSVMSHN